MGVDEQNKVRISTATEAGDLLDPVKIGNSPCLVVLFTQDNLHCTISQYFFRIFLLFILIMIHIAK